MLKDKKIIALYNVYTQLLHSNLSLFLGPDNSSLYGKVLLRINLKNSQWSFNYLSYFLFYFNSRYQFCSYIMGCVRNEDNEVDLTLLLDMNEIYVGDTTENIVFLFLSWLDFNGVIMHFFFPEQPSPYIFIKSQTAGCLWRECICLDNKDLELSFCYLTRNSLSYNWFVESFQNIDNTQYFVFDLANTGIVKWCSNLQSWNIDIRFLLENYAKTFYYYTNYYFEHNYKDRDFSIYHESCYFHPYINLNLNLFFICFPKDKKNVVHQPDYLKWLSFSNTSLIPISLTFLFNAAAHLALKCISFRLCYTHINACSSVIQNWFLYSFKLLKGLEFIFFCQTESNLARKELSFYCIINKYFEIEDLEKLLFSEFGLNFQFDETMLHEYLNKCLWTYYNRVLAGNYSENWDVFNTLSRVYTTKCVDVDWIFCTDALYRQNTAHNPHLTEYEESYQSDKSLYLVTRYSSGGII